MIGMDVRSRNAGRAVASVYVRIKPVLQYIVFIGMIVYQCYDCVSDGMNFSLYSEGDLLDVSSRNERAYQAFFFSLIVSVLCAISSSLGYLLLIIGLSKTLHRHQKEKDDTFKLGRLIVFISLFCQVCFEESIQGIVIYYYIVRCSVVYSFWKVSLYVCTILSLLVSGYTFFKGAYVWFKKRDSLPRKYPPCFAPCYHSMPSLVGCVALCIFGMILALGLFTLNIVTLVDIIKHSEVDIPHVVAMNKHQGFPAVKILPVKNLVKSNGVVTKMLPCTVPGSGSRQSHFLGEQQSANCSSVTFTLSFAKKTKRLKYKVHYCYHDGRNCNQVRNTNVTLQYTHKLCSADSPIFSYLTEPDFVLQTTPNTFPNTTTEEIKQSIYRFYQN